MKHIALVACASLTLLLAACNTMEGAGQDIKAGGQDLSNAAANTKDRMHDSDDHY